MHDPDASRRGVANLRLDVIARSEATKQSILSLRGEMDCFASLAMTLRWRRHMRDAPQPNVAPTFPNPDNSIITASPVLSHTVFTKLPVSTISPARSALPSEAR
jgi:hypothetical protein